MGGVAIEKLESWLLAIAGVRHSETLRRPEERLAELGVRPKQTTDMTTLVERNGLSEIPEDAYSLKRWLSRAEQALGQT